MFGSALGMASGRPPGAILASFPSLRDGSVAGFKGHPVCNHGSAQLRWKKKAKTEDDYSEADSAADAVGVEHQRLAYIVESGSGEIGRDAGSTM